jgi:branched-chain amino acid transport system substrate-binding protein
MSASSRGARVQTSLRTALAAAVASACTSGEPVRIGLVVSGEAVPGAEIAVEEINASGGIGGRSLELRVVAAGGSSRASVAIAQAETLAADRSVIGVVGHSNSSATLAAAQIYNASGVVQIAPTSSSPLLSQAGQYTFRLVANDVHQARFLSAAVTEEAAPRVAVVFVNDDYGRTLHEEFEASLRRADVPIVYEYRYAEGDSLHDATAIAADIVASRPSVLAWLGRSVQLGQLLPTLRRSRSDLRVLASDGVDNATVNRNADGVFTGVQFACFLDPESSRAQMRTLRDRFRRKTGQRINVEATLAYDAVHLIAEAARASGPDRDAIRDHIASIGSTRPAHEGASGAVAFDKHRDPRPAYCLAEITSSGRRTIAPKSE